MTDPALEAAKRRRDPQASIALLEAALARNPNDVIAQVNLAACRKLAQQDELRAQALADLARTGRAVAECPACEGVGFLAKADHPDCGLCRGTGRIHEVRLPDRDEEEPEDPSECSD